MNLEKMLPLMAEKEKKEFEYYRLKARERGTEENFLRFVIMSKEGEKRKEMLEKEPWRDTF